MATGDFDMTAVIEADRRVRKEWEGAVSRATSIHFPGRLCELCIGIRAAHPIIVADMEGSDADHPIATERKTVAEHVADILSDLQFGKCTRSEAAEVKRAAKRAMSDHDVSRSVGKL